jgi:hypothetical protein
MIVVRPTSFTATLDTAAKAFSDQLPHSPLQGNEIAKLVFSCQCLPGQNAGFFLPFAVDRKFKARLFPGKPLHTEFIRRYIQLIEAARLLKLLAIENHY